MGTNIKIIVFCSLFLTIFAEQGHEKSHQHHTARKTVNHHQQALRRFHHPVLRADNDQHCRWVCDNSTNGNDSESNPPTTGNEKSHHHHTARKTLNHHQQALRRFHHPVLRADDDQHCRWVCDNSTNVNGSKINPSTTGNGNQLQLVYNEQTSLVAVVNLSAEVARIIDYKTNAGGFLNGHLGVAIVVDYNSYTVYHVNISQAVWVASKQSFEAYFSSLSSLQIIIDAGKQNGIGVNISNIDDATLQEISDIQLLIGGKSPVSLNDLQKIVDESKKIIEALQGPLRGLYKGKGAVNIQLGIDWVSNVELALGLLLEGVPGGIEALEKEGVTLDLSKIFGATSGLDVLLEVLTQIGEHVDLAKTLGNVLNNPELLLQIVSLFKCDKGVDGILTIVYNILSLISGKGSIDKLIQSIVKFTANGGFISIIGPDLPHIVNGFLNLTASQDKIFHNRAGLEGFVKFLEQLNNSNFIVNNINISDIIKLLTSANASGSGLDYGIKILLKLGSLFDPIRDIPLFFHQIVNLLNGTSNIQTLTNLIPGLNLGNLSNSSNILQSALQGINLKQYLNGSGISELSHIPVIGDIISQISKSLNSSFDIGKLLNSSSIVGTIQQVLGGGGPLGIFGEIVQQVEHGLEDILGGGSGILRPILGSTNLTSSGPLGVNFPGSLGFDKRKHLKTLKHYHNHDKKDNKASYQDDEKKDDKNTHNDDKKDEKDSYKDDDKREHKQHLHGKFRGKQGHDHH